MKLKKKQKIFTFIQMNFFLKNTEIFTGAYALLSYASMVFDQAGSTLSPNTSSIIVGGIQIIGTLVSVCAVDRTGRKFLMITSALGCTIGLISFGTFDLLNAQKVDVSQFRWIPLASFSFVIFFANIGN
jgi:Sugar (and other) transporter